MRTPPSTWLALSAALSGTATAFYPYNFDSDTTSHVRRLPEAKGAPLDAVTLPLRRVASPLRSRQNAYNILNSNDPKQENSVAIDQDGGDLSYMVAVTFGDSKEEYHLLLDSAASNTWVMGQDCTTESCKTHTTFGNGDSSTLKEETTPFSVTYGTGSVRGTLASDTLHIGALSPTLTFGLATNVSEEFRSYPMDGILGIGRGTKTSSGINAPQVMDVLASSSLLPSKRYAIHLSRARDSLLDGELNFGDLNPAHFSGAINYIPCVPSSSTGFWEIPLTDAGVDGAQLGFTGKTAIIDTGTSFILMPRPDAEALHARIPGSAQSGETFSVPCDTSAVVQFSFGNTVYNISTSDWRGGKLDSGLCRSNIVGRQTFSASQWLVGDVFLKNVYAVFDYEMEGGSVGFGVKGVETQSLDASSSPSASASSTTTASAVLAASPAAHNGPATSSGAASPPNAASTPHSGASSSQVHVWTTLFACIIIIRSSTFF
ncbi:hypothetical protein ACN47E_006069 [Coniothyrium glycines]